MISVADSYLSSTRTGTDRIVQKGLYMDIQLFSSKDLNSFTQPITGRSWIHIWLFSLTDYEIFKKEASCLSCDERKRVEKYVHESDRKRYIISILPCGSFWACTFTPARNHLPFRPGHTANRSLMISPPIRPTQRKHLCPPPYILISLTLQI